MVPSRIRNRKTSITTEDHRRFNFCLEEQDEPVLSWSLYVPLKNA